MSRNERVGIGSAVAGAVVALALTAFCVLVGLALLASEGPLDFANFATDNAVAAAWVAVSVAVGTFIGARTAAMSAHAMARRDGALNGLVTGSFLSLLALAGACFLAVYWPASRAAELLWGAAGLELIILF